jgi:hypothetical protein
MDYLAVNAALTIPKAARAARRPVSAAEVMKDAVTAVRADHGTGTAQPPPLRGTARAALLARITLV